MPIQMPQKPKSGLGKVMGLGEVIGGAVTGQPELVAAGASSLASDSPLGKAAGIYNKGSSLTGDAPSDAGTAIDRRLTTEDVHPDVHIANALETLNDKNLPIDYETRMSAVEPLLRAKHFGFGGGLDNQGVA